MVAWLQKVSINYKTLVLSLFILLITARTTAKKNYYYQFYYYYHYSKAPHEFPPPLSLTTVMAPLKV